MCLLAFILLPPQDAGVDPFTHRGVARMFREHYRAFWDAAIKEAAAQEVLFDGRLPDRITNTVTALSWWVVIWLAGTGLGALPSQRCTWCASPLAP